MKKFFIFWGAVLFSLNILNAQIYMDDPGNNWQVTFFAYGWDSDYFSDYDLRFTGEVLQINNRNYKEIEYRVKHRYYPGPGDEFWSGWETTNVYLYENHSQKEVWVYYPESESPVYLHESGEFLLYDFDLNIGDSIPYEGFSTGFDSPFPMVITEITYEYVFNLDAQPVKTFWFEWTEEAQIPFVIYEGIGTSHGPLEYSLSWDVGLELTGFREVLSIDSVDNSNYVIYPNPFKDKIRIESTEEIERIQLFDTAGKLRIESLNQRGLNKHISALNHGVYILKIYFKNKKAETFKLIKK